MESLENGVLAAQEAGSNIGSKLTEGPSADAIATSIEVYRLGEKLRQLRLKKKISLVDLGKHTGLSPSMLSQLENGKLIPTLPTLTRIAMVFDVGLEFFFSEQRGAMFSIVRAGERLRFPDHADSDSPSYFFECLAFSAREKSMEAYVGEFPPRATPSTPHTHEGSEFLYVTQGSLEIRTPSDAHTLAAGDSCYFDSAVPHSYRSASDQTATAIVVTTRLRS